MEKTTNQEEQIFLAALELGPDADRNEFLKNECGDDGQLRNRVEELLAFHQRGDNILDDTSGGLLGRHHVETDSITVGSHIGPYKLLQEIGVGGMGVVYMAEQSQPVRRKVAIKIIKLGMDTRNVIARFEAERQALAMMDHPNITRIFDAGTTTTGRPYFVMELVTGLAITDYCDREKLSLRNRIELFHQVCVGIKHAHQKGIIHRDLKPSNVMVTHYDGVAVPKIIDFGIAKAVNQSLTEKTLFTSYGNMIGTPEYMSPEQAEMSGQDIDTRADVYSLGVLMYELLTGTTPFYHWKKKGIHKFCEAICNEEPELASTRVNNMADTVNEISSNRGTDARSLKRILRGEMDWILAKCMSKKRNERYESAADLARDVKRFLDGQPVEAVGPNMSYRARKFVSKHRTAMSFAAVIVITLCSATVVSTVFAIQATRAQKLANNRLQQVDVLRKQAEIDRDRAQAAEKKYIELSRRRGSKAATAQAVERFYREYPHEKVHVHYPFRHQRLPRLSANWSGGGANMTVHDHLNGEHTADVHVVGVQAAQTDSTKTIDSNHSLYEYQVIIGDDGELKVVTIKAGTAEMLELHDDQHGADQFVLIQDQEGASGTKRFLRLLADERREVFGPNDDLVANTLIEIGNVSLKHQDWSIAENNFRECRDILKRHGNKDARLARVELLLCKALLHQEKTAAAREIIVNGVVHLEMLREMPDELIDVVVDLKANLTERNIDPHKLGEFLHERLQERHKKEVENKLKLEFRNK